MQGSVSVVNKKVASKRFLMGPYYSGPELLKQAGVIIGL